ncbi:CD209 antigen-like protein C isoform X2 [Trichosurus vulpecula]|uniref:CD209 antigen-like protein C isoform X2 n=1 Tax=Trichosurus vulpecula TaxID=9337 RepID=UPI00186B4547|nr:CD209 antigen-like protein C isoform X2 [Trichosurus vulpecula]
MCDTEDPKSTELAGLDEEVLMPSGWSHFNLGSPRSQSLRNFPAPWLSRLGFLMMMVFFALSFILSIIILSQVFQNQSQLEFEAIQKKLNQFSAQLKDNGAFQNQSQLEFEAIQKKLNQLSAQWEDNGDLKAKEQSETSQLIKQLNKTLSTLCSPCPCDWKFYKDSCYHFSVYRKPWDAAREACEADNSNLVIIDSSEEQKYLKKRADSNHRWWVGLSDKKKEGTWHWVDGTTLKEAFWNEGEPNNAGDEDCCELISQGWNDAPCSKENYWVCEKEATPCTKL